MFGIGNPQWLLQPWKNLKQFTESLYAALDAARTEPLTHEGPVVIRVPEGQAALRIERRSADAQDLLRPGSGPRTASPAGDQAPNPIRERMKREEPPERARGPRGRSTESEARVATGVSTEPPTRRERHIPIEGAIEFSSKEPVRFAQPPQVWSDSKKEWWTPPALKLPDDLPFPELGGGGGGGTFVYLGKVLSCPPGGPASVDIYPAGPSGDKLDGGPFEVDLPTISSDEDLSGVTWLPGIYQFTDSDGNVSFEAYPAVWVS